MWVCGCVFVNTYTCMYIFIYTYICICVIRAQATRATWWVYVYLCVCACFCVCPNIKNTRLIHIWFTCVQKSSTRLILILQLGDDAQDACASLSFELREWNIFRKRATNYRAVLRKGTYKDQASFASLPPCATPIHPKAWPIHIWMYMYICTHVQYVQVYIFWIHIFACIRVYICKCVYTHTRICSYIHR